VSAALAEWTDAAVILAVVTLNAVVGAFQEGRAERSLAALRRLVVLHVRVRRDGGETIVDARDLVPGDVLVLAAGDKVGADARVVGAENLRLAEAALTGESAPVDKHPAALPADTALAERRNMAYAGTHVTAGRGVAVVASTGAATELGRIAQLTAAAVEPPTPLARRIDRFGRALLVVAGVLFAVVLATGLLRGLPFHEVLVVGISQIVSLVPEGLPVALTIALAVGVQRMARRGAIVRRLSAVETLGSVTTICTDKTGTLTRNEMAVVEVRAPGEPAFRVRGEGYEPKGRFDAGGEEGDPAALPGTRRLLEALALCNDATISPPSPESRAWTPVGDPTEAALVTLASRAGLDLDALRRERPRTGEIPFESGRRSMATEHDVGGRRVVYVKGSPDAVLPLCRAMRSGGEVTDLTPAAREGVAASVQSLASGALRVLAACEVEGADVKAGYEALRGQGVFLGLVGEIDPPREEVPKAVAECRSAGIRPVMVTGDEIATGVAIAREVGLSGEADLARSGADLDALGPDGLRREVDRIAVYGRVRPEQKLRIVEALQARGEVVVMTGDGVNDAPALAQADVGVAMGLSGTEAAREASKMVITDDDFATIVAAVREGRIVYRNLRKAILLQLSTSVAEVLILLGALFLGMPLPLAAVQILWNNVVTETVITINLVLEPGEGDEMSVAPVPVGESLLPRDALWRAALLCVAIAGAVLGIFAWHLARHDDFALAQTATFTMLAVCEWFNVLNVRSATRTALEPSIFRNRWLVGGLLVANLLQMAVVFLPSMNAVFHTVPLPLTEVLLIAAVGSLVLWTDEIRKAVVRARARRVTASETA
jgi:magnesium-transporting ATPase (P-type)